VDRRYVVLAALKALADEGAIDRKVVVQAVKKLGVDAAKANPLNS
jgi:pyruvate dehydrogenase E1 component